ncbi:MAG: glycosyltransferase family 39 protein [Thermoflexales bacterium]|nr:glycosyltransferase family 39 protein [Thermoflexales bacterium]
MHQSKTLATLTLILKVACFAAVIALGLSAYSSGNLAYLGAALIAAAVGFRLPADLSVLARPAARAVAGDAPPEETAEQPSAPAEPVNARSALAAAGSFLRDRPVAAPLAGAVLLSAIAAVLPAGSATVLLSAVLWVLAMGLALRAFSLKDRRDGRSLPAGLRLDRADIAFMVFFFGLALLVRAYDMADYPPYMHVDEGAQGVSTLRVLSGSIQPPFAYPANSWTFPFALEYVQGLFIRLFGQNETGLRFSSAFFGSLTVAFTYGAARLAFRGRLAGIASASLLAFFHPNVHYSRIALGMEAAPWFPLLVLGLAMADADDGVPGTRHPVMPFAIAGMAVAFAQYGYAAGKLALVLLPIYLVFLALRKRCNWMQVGVAALAFVVAAGPLIYQYLLLPSSLLARTSVNVLRPEILQHTLGPGATLPADLVPLMQKQLASTLDALVWRGDTSGFYQPEIPMLDPVLAVLFWIGVGLAVLRIRRFGGFSVLTWLGLTMLIGVALTVDPPGGPRWMVGHAAIAMLGGLTVQHAWQAITSVAGTTLRWLAAPLLAGLLVLSAVKNVDSYFVDYAGRQNYSDGIHAAREFAREPQNYYGFMLGESPFGSFSVTRYMASQSTIETVQDVALIPAPGINGRGILIVATPAQFGALESYRVRFPGGEDSTYSVRGTPLYRAYRIQAP